MSTTSTEKHSTKSEDMVKQIKLGETAVREKLIGDNWDNIVTITSKIIRRPAEGTDEFSIALSAFNEAIDSYNPSKNDNFLCFSRLVINRRLIDHIRKNSRHRSEIFHSFEDQGMQNPIIKEAVTQLPDFIDKIEIEEEILKFKLKLQDYGISFKDLIALSPKHADTRRLCVYIADSIIDNNGLSQRLEKDRRLPVIQLMQIVSVSRKTIEKHRKYIISLYLAMKSDMDIIKSYIGLARKGGNQ